MGMLAVVAAGSIIAAAMLNLGPSAGNEQPPATTVPATTAAPAATPKPTPSVADDPVTVVQNYYGLLPGDTDSAWQLLGPQAQSQVGGPSGYNAFWAEVATVSVQNLRQTGDDTVEGTVVFARGDGGTSSEPTGS
jgi:hypothetical protein